MTETSRLARRTTVAAVATVVGLALVGVGIWTQRQRVSMQAKSGASKVWRRCCGRGHDSGRERAPRRRRRVPVPRGRGRRRRAGLRPRRAARQPRRVPRDLHARSAGARRRVAGGHAAQPARADGRSRVSRRRAAAPLHVSQDDAAVFAQRRAGGARARTAADRAALLRLPRRRRAAGIDVREEISGRSTSDGTACGPGDALRGRTTPCWRSSRKAGSCY